MRYIYQRWRPCWPPSWILPKIKKIIKKRWKLDIVNPSHVKYDILKHLTAFCMQCLLFSPKRRITHSFTQKWLDPLLLMTSCLVTIVTDSHQTYGKMCLRDMPTATGNGRCWRKIALEKFKKNIMGGGIHPPPPCRVFWERPRRKTKVCEEREVTPT